MSDETSPILSSRHHLTFRSGTDFPDKVRLALAAAFGREEEVEFLHAGANYVVEPDWVVATTGRFLDCPEYESEEGDGQ